MTSIKSIEKKGKHTPKNEDKHAIVTHTTHPTIFFFVSFAPFLFYSTKKIVIFFCFFFFLLLLTISNQTRNKHTTQYIPNHLFLFFFSPFHPSPFCFLFSFACIHFTQQHKPTNVFKGSFDSIRLFSIAINSIV